MKTRDLIAWALLPITAACATVPPPQTTGAPPQQPMANAYGQPVQLMGMDAKALIATFGQPRLDIQEPTMRKLQFANGACVLDTYLYPQKGAKNPVVTYVDARLPNGKDAEAGACALALKARK